MAMRGWGSGRQGVGRSTRIVCVLGGRMGGWRGGHHHLHERQRDEHVGELLGEADVDVPAAALLDEQLDLLLQLGAVHQHRVDVDRRPQRPPPRREGVLDELHVVPHLRREGMNHCEGGA